MDQSKVGEDIRGHWYSTETKRPCPMLISTYRPIFRKSNWILSRVQQRGHRECHQSGRSCVCWLPNDPRAGTRTYAEEMVPVDDRQRGGSGEAHHMGERQAIGGRKGRSRLRSQLLRMVQRGSSENLWRYHPGLDSRKQGLHPQGARRRLWTDHAVSLTLPFTTPPPATLTRTQLELPRRDDHA